MANDARVCIDYVNHRGQRALRSVTPKRVWFGETEWHPDGQWLLEGFDHDRGETRNYAISDIISWRAVDRDTGGQVVPGIYRHFKGGLYQVIETARDSESEDVFVVYRTLYGTFSLWIRPIGMFSETVFIEGDSVQRFKLVAPL